MYSATVASVPYGLTSWDIPFPYLGTTVSAAKFMMNASLVTQYMGGDRDKIVVDILGQGPIPWSISRYNRGDLSPRLQPRSGHDALVSDVEGLATWQLLVHSFGGLFFQVLLCMCMGNARAHLH